ncbi:MAG: BsaWI family type II restriction enzyme [Candidatus Calescibacterium sp.]|nr:BsaWI family type II restriction enzyme [Candidatus Calescibacterium sp.]MCX7988421.1 BsaWI family type II restriction enzyme [Thermodesulfovibrio sp.]
MVYSKEFSYPVCIVSCKTSLHGRLTETLFYAVYYRLMRKIKYVLVTPDRGKKSGSYEWESEWGTNEKPSKNRLLASLFLDGVYVNNKVEFMPKNFEPKIHKTVLGGIVKELNNLPRDIINWHSEIN